MDLGVGIDLGTTYSAIAVMNERGRAEVLRTRDGQKTTPSILLFDPDETEPLVGEEARVLAEAMPDRLVTAVKREMGRPTEWEFDGRVYTPIDLSSLMLRQLKRDGEAALGRPIRDVVVTVPAYFANAEREATRQAAVQAGLNILQIINEPTAAAIAHRVDHPASEGLILVYDLGGGTFDVTLLQVAGEDFHVVATQGDVELGGKDWDRLLAERAAEVFRDTYGADPLDDDEAYALLFTHAESAKRALTETARAVIPCRVGPNALRVRVTREEFEEMALPLLERTRSTVLELLDRAGCGPAASDSVLLVGGSTRMPMVRNMLAEMFPEKVDARIHPDLCVAVGAATLAARLSLGKLSAGAKAGLTSATRKLMRMSVQDVTAHSLGTAILGDEDLATSIVIPKDSPIPARKTRTDYTTNRDDQDSLLVPVLQGEAAKARSNQLLACYEFSGISPRPAGASPLEVTFQYDASGIVEVQARDVLSDTVLNRMEYPIQSLDELVSSRPMPLAILFLIDTSGSMGRELDGVKTSGLAFAQRIMGSGLACQLGLIDFDMNTSGVYKWEVFGPMGPEQFPDAVSGLRIGRLGGAGCYVGEPNTLPVIQAFVDAFPPEGYARIGILVSDEVGNDDDAVRETIRILKEAEVCLHVFGVPGSCHEVLARETGGRFWDIIASRGHADFSDLLEAVAEEICNLAVACSPNRHLKAT